MDTGEVIDDRFEVEYSAGAGGMGQVFRAHDRLTGQPVALKLLRWARDSDLSRFEREAQALSTLKLPGVVGYVAHGVFRADQPYLAMQWLAGETLSQRLARSELQVSECVTLAARIASTLGAVHRLGIVHRDLKPSNLLLVDGDIERATLIDFGIARISWLGDRLTRTGAVIGTPGYMAPEQAHGAAAVDARADVFALGCVVYRCLTGHNAFQGAGLGLLAKVLLEDPPPVRARRPDVPERLDALVARMLAKAPADRPYDGTAVAAELASIEVRSGGWSPPSIDEGGHPRSTAALRKTVGGITTEERRITCLVIAYGAIDPSEGPYTEADMQRRRAALDPLAASFDARLELLDGSSPMLVLSGGTVATDLAERAARSALALQARLGRVPVVLVTGRAERSGTEPIAALIDRAAQLLPHTSARWDAVRVDAVTLGLLGGRFELAEDVAGGWLKRSHAQRDARTELLGKPIPCIGRERELALLHAELNHCVEESTPGAVVILGQAGLGKSRLRYELVRRLKESGHGAQIWFGKADAMSAGSAFGLVSRALCDGLGLVEGEPLEARHEKILARVQTHAERGIDARHVAAFLGEIVGAPFPDEHNAKLRAARRSPMLMNSQISEAWRDFVQAEAAERPLVLVLEDLHWGDRPTVSLVGMTLTRRAGLPVFVLALGRPEADALFPNLWEHCAVQRLNLTPLSARASERLLRHALGARADAALIERLVARADGNAFFLEELIRAAAAGKVDDLPETVLAMVQARLETLDEGARRALRAASVFGETFWQNGVAAVLGNMHVGPLLDELAQREVIAKRYDAELAGQVEYRFRHALVREAAYGMLTASDTQLAHALAGDWLDQTGQADPLALAEHFERGDRPERAAGAYLRAAEQALRGNDLESALARADRGLQHTADASTSGALCRVQAEAFLWRGKFSLAEERASLAVERLAPGSTAAFAAATEVIVAAAKQGELDRLEAFLRRMIHVKPEAGAETARSIFLAECATSLIFGGRYALADELIGAVEDAIRGLDAPDPEIVARVEQVRALRLTPARDPEAFLAAFEAVLSAFQQAGDGRNACVAQQNLGFCYSEIGDFAAAEAALRGALQTAERMALQDTIAWCQHNLGLVLARGGNVAEGKIAEAAALATAEQLGDPRLAGAARCYLAQIALLGGELDEAEREAQRAIGVLDQVPPVKVLALAVRAQALVGLGRPDEALVAAREAASGLAALGTIDEGESLVRLALAEALMAAGAMREGKEALGEAHRALLARAAAFRDSARRERFLWAIPHHARTLELSGADSTS